MGFKDQRLGSLGSLLEGRSESGDTATHVDGAEHVAPSAVRLIQATKMYGDFVAVDRLDLDIRRRELFTLLGPSGSGKTTVLRMIAGLVRPNSGEVWIGDERVEARPPYDRNVGYVFQSLALFPHMDVFGNVAFPLRMRRLGRTEISGRVAQALEMVRLPNLGHRKLSELSGGQQQRVALARALVYEPELLLLDEPLGSLDRRLREEMQVEIARIHQVIDVTIVNVTHDQREALMLSDRIGVMRLGRLEQVGGNRDLYRNPRTRFVASFLGEANLLLGRASTDGTHNWITIPTGTHVHAGAITDGLVGRECAVVVRAESLRVWSMHGHAAPEADNRFAGQVTMKAFEGSSLFYEVHVPALGSTLKVLTPAGPTSEEFDVGQDVHVGWDPSSADVLGPDEAEHGESTDFDAAH